ncbi:MAG: type II CAAX prenyl endopeptidase Rce1 family protein [Cyanobacteriota bacterium]
MKVYPQRRARNVAARWSMLFVLGLPQAPFPSFGTTPRGSASLASPSPAGTATQPLPVSSEALARQSIWSRPESYPLSLRPRGDLYRPSADWIGRLLLPTPQDTADPAAPRDDWVWVLLEQAPAGRQDLIGQRLRLRWAGAPHLQRLVATVTSDIRLGEQARQAAEQANVVPTRLDGRRVGPLQSLAGARPVDDLTVLLEGVTVGNGELRIARPPVQISGRWQGLVTVVGPGPGEDLWTVRHFNAATGRLDGPEDTIRIPALPPDRFGRRLIDPSGLGASAANGQGWLIQGAPAADGVFTVQALLPSSYLDPSPRNVVRGTDSALAFLRHDSWSGRLLRRGTLHRATLLPDGEHESGWELGERALLMHLFGGIGGDDGEPVKGWTVTGHFSFGEARVVRDAFTGQPRLAIRYHQIYATNPNGIVAGSQDWSAYAGSLQRGWIGLRPFSDVLVPIGADVVEAIALQAEIMAARYRSGDGRGVALVTPATSCVQDSGQALWIALRQLRQQGDTVPMTPLERDRLRKLGQALDQLLKPFGTVRGDWAHNAERSLAAGTGQFETSQSPRDALLSWRSILPRGAHDRFAAEFLAVGLPLEVRRANQIPGANPRLEPVAPTLLFGQLPWLASLLGRLEDSLFPLERPVSWVATVGLALGTVALALSRGWGGLALLVPALVEELVFRVLLLPSALDGLAPLMLVPWLALSVGAFVAWHGLTIRWRQGGRRLGGAAPQVLGRMGLLGGVCALAYVVSGSLWPPVLIHWLALLVWTRRPRR